MVNGKIPYAVILAVWLCMGQVAEIEYQAVEYGQKIKQYAVINHVSEEGANYFAPCNDCACELSISDPMNRLMWDAKPSVDEGGGLFTNELLGPGFTGGTNYDLYHNCTSTEFGNGGVYSTMQVSQHTTAELDPPGDTVRGPSLAQTVENQIIWACISPPDLNQNFDSQSRGVVNILQYGPFRFLGMTFCIFYAILDYLGVEVGNALLRLSEFSLALQDQGLNEDNLISYMIGFGEFAVLMFKDPGTALVVLIQKLWWILGSIFAAMAIPLMLLEMFIIYLSIGERDGGMLIVKFVTLHIQVADFIYKTVMRFLLLLSNVIPGT